MASEKATALLATVRGAITAAGGEGLLRNGIINPTVIPDHDLVDVAFYPGSTTYPHEVYDAVRAAITALEAQELHIQHSSVGCAFVVAPLGPQKYVLAKARAGDAYLGFGARIMEVTGSIAITRIPAEHANWLFRRLQSGLDALGMTPYDTLDEARAAAEEWRNL